MISFSGLGIGLSLVFGCLLFALVAELYYLLWWKKRSFNSEVEDEFTSYAKEFFHLICWRRSSSSSSSIQANNSLRNPEIRNQEPDIEIGSSKDLLLKSSGGEDGVELELMRLHNLAGPPRFLFTIKEETKEDLESEDRSRKGSRTRSLSDLILALDTPFLTPLPSPPFNPPSPFSSFKHHGFNINPLFESSTDFDLNRLISSPPPKFRFLREAEEKLYRRLMEESQKKACKNGGSIQNPETPAISNPIAAAEDEEDDEFCCRKEKELQNHYVSQYSSSSSQILPLASSPPSGRRIDHVSIT
ncbi:uncharacterized protein LOC111499670 isoform X1 [Cucurbita maxima]|uniref:Uncharacterized protein LOC111499670 isoform X1 n=1 Tax=Cucurbita maxima TaxID=3661 RepID=A0A6J1KZH4_CUCMA|nr:uncharacterized protein LOC111499670 isoform X1 [Cucurbita maxima]